MSYKVEIPCGICHKFVSILTMRVTPNPLLDMYVWVCKDCWNTRPDGTIQVSMELNRPDMYTIHKN